MGRGCIGVVSPVSGVVSLDLSAVDCLLRCLESCEELDNQTISLRGRLVNPIVMLLSITSPVSLPHLTRIAIDNTFHSTVSLIMWTFRIESSFLPSKLG